MDSLHDILVRMEARSDTPQVLRDAIRVGSLEEANERLQTALEQQFWNKPYLLAGAVTDVPVWPSDHSLADLLVICQAKLTLFGKSKSYAAVQLRAAEKTLGRMIDTAAKLHAEGVTVGADRYTCNTCGASALHDLPPCPRDSIRDCDVTCERVSEIITDERTAA